MREAQFLRRSQFDEIQYGSAVLKRNGKGAILRPVITAHGHFRILKIRYPDVKTHIISHECFLRGAIITAWADQFRQQQGELWFVEEEISDSNADTPWHFKGTTYHGWWQNQWQRWEQGNNCKMVCLLTGASLERGKCFSGNQSLFYHMADRPTRLYPKRVIIRRSRNANADLTGVKIQ